MKEFKSVAVTSSIAPMRFSKHTREQIGSIFLAAVRADMEKPEFREGFEKWLLEREAETAAK